MVLIHLLATELRGPKTASDLKMQNSINNLRPSALNIKARPKFPLLMAKPNRGRPATPPKSPCHLLSPILCRAELPSPPAS